MKKSTFVTLMLLVCIAVAARAEVKLSAVGIETTGTATSVQPAQVERVPRQQELEEEYSRTMQRIAEIQKEASELQAHALRLEGAITIIREVNDKLTTSTK